MVAVKPHKDFKGVYIMVLDDGSNILTTKNLAPGHSVYDEHLFQIGIEEYRSWDPYKSKLAGAILKGLPSLPIQPSDRVLYLGAATGTTVSHIADIIGAEGLVYAVEFSSRPMRELIIKVVSHRENVYPLYADARFPEKYRFLLREVDIIYCDIAQPRQAQILADNARIFLKCEGGALLAVKARSIDSTRNPNMIFAEEAETLKSRGFKIQKMVSLSPYDRAHAMILAKFDKTEIYEKE